MPDTIFLAGAAGTVGRRLTPLLVSLGYRVFGMTRSRDRTTVIEAAGATPAIVDVFDKDALSGALARIRPAIVVQQLTDLPFALPPSQMPDAAPRNARVRDEGTRNLVGAAIAAGARRMVAQSIAWAYARRHEPHVEDDALDLAAEGVRAISVNGVVALERAVMTSPPLAGTVLRYGRFYGPGTGVDKLPERPTLHVDAAASAAALAVTTGATGIFNIADPDGGVAIEKARRELGWVPSFRIGPGNARSG